jgi:hypothetical protein
MQKQDKAINIRNMGGRLAENQKPEEGKAPFMKTRLATYAA